MFKLIKHYYMRCRYGYSDQDCWNVNSHLCDIIPPMVRNLKKYNNGCPSDIYDVKRKNNECWKWKEILEEIAQGFEAAQGIERMEYFQFKKNKEGSYDNWIDKKKQEQLTKKFDKGMMLFVKYFWGLWD